MRWPTGSRAALRGSAPSFPTSPTPALVVAGGVAANRQIRAALEAQCREQRLPLRRAAAWLCTDNAAMIAWAGIERLARRARRRGRLRLRAALALAARQRLRAGRRLGPAGSQGMSGEFSVAVLGGGAWGTALAHADAPRRPRRAAVGARRRDGRGDRTRRKSALSAGRRRSMPASSRRPISPQALDGADCVLAVTPAQALRGVLEHRRRRYAAQAFRWCSAPRASSARPGCCCRQIAGEILPGNPVAALSGPSFATDVAKGLPTAVVVAARDEARAAALAAALLDRTFPLLFDRRPRRRRDRRRAEERLRHRRRRGHRRRARRQRPGRHGHARLRRAAPHRRRPSAPSRRR